MFAMFVGCRYYPNSGAADFYGMIPDLKPETVNQFIMDFMIDLVRSTPKIQDPIWADRHAEDDFDGVFTALNLETKEIYGSYLVIEYGGREVRVTDTVERYPFGYGDKVVFPPLPVIEATYEFFHDLDD